MNRHLRTTGPKMCQGHVFHCKFDLKEDKPVKVATMGYPNGRNHIATGWKNRKIQPLTQLEWD
eukprot:scaffold3181_cov80-Cylindrotheca_fusiformis.AAC.1